MNSLPFRQRLTVWSTLVAGVSILICGAGAAWFVFERGRADIEEELQGESAHLFSELARHGGASFDWKGIDHAMSEWLPAETPPRYMEIRTGPAVRWRSANLPAPGFASYSLGRRDVTLGQTALRVLVVEEGGVTLAIGADLDEARALARGLAVGLLAGLPLALAFAWFGGRGVAALAVRPVLEMTATIEEISAERLDRRVPVPAVADEIQRHARMLNATLDRLERSYQQAVRFSGDASHELKTPLTVLRASIEAVLDSPNLCDNDRAAVGSLLEQIHRLSNITASLLLLARADAGRLTLDLAEHDLAVLAEACLDDARIVAEQRGVHLAASPLPPAPARVDALRFAQIISNLLDNAVKYNCAGGEVRVALTPNGQAWRIAVANTGPLIAPEHREQLFERFFRVEHTAEEPGHGLGLGLARELARAHGGDVSLVRSDSGWTEFAVTFPKNATPS